MKYLRYFSLLAALVFVMATASKSSQANAQASFGVGIGATGYAAAPVCQPNGYYDYYPYACAPYGFYGPDWFAGGLFIGAGPWYHHGWYPGVYRGGFAPHSGFVGRRPSGFHGSSGFHGRGR